MKKISLLVVCLFSTVLVCGQGWSNITPRGVSLNIGGNGIYTSCTDKFGNIYVAGDLFDSSGNTYVAKWDGTSWHYPGEGSRILNGYHEITCMMTDTSGNIYIGGEGSDSGYVAKWDGSAWSMLGTRPGSIFTMCFDRYGNMYAAGALGDSTGHGYVAKWDGISWSEVGTGVNALKANGGIYALCTDTAGNIYAGGYFTDGSFDTAGNIYVAKWDGTSWSELGSGICRQHDIDNAIYSILADTAGNIYTTGYVDSGITGVYKWDGSSWGEVGTGLYAFDSGGVINSMCFDKLGNLYIAGFVSTEINNNVFKWDGVSWSQLGTLNADQAISCLFSDTSGSIYAAGVFNDTTSTFYFNHVYPHVAPYYVAKYSSITTGIAPVRAAATIHIYPNPAHDELNAAGITGNTEYRLFNVTGACLEQGVLQQNKHSISTANCVPGTYILEMTDTDGNKYISKVIKE